jgi:serine/threonine protein kinase HipA of HipAB toxin-antitoxin module
MTTLQKMEENRDENKKLLKQKKSLIIKQISAAKSKVLKYLDDIEERLITEVESVQEKHFHGFIFNRTRSGNL